MYKFWCGNLQHVRTNIIWVSKEMVGRFSLFFSFSREVLQWRQNHWDARHIDYGYDCIDLSHIYSNFFPPFFWISYLVMTIFSANFMAKKIKSIVILFDSLKFDMQLLTSISVYVCARMYFFKKYSIFFQCHSNVLVYLSESALEVTAQWCSATYVIDEKYDICIYAQTKTTDWAHNMYV